MREKYAIIKSEDFVSTKRRRFPKVYLGTGRIHRLLLDFVGSLVP